MNAIDIKESASINNTNGRKTAPVKFKDHHAILTVYNLALLSDKDRFRLVKWLRDTAEEIHLSDPSDYSHRYHAKLCK